MGLLLVPLDHVCLSLSPSHPHSTSILVQYTDTMFMLELRERCGQFFFYLWTSALNILLSLKGLSCWTWHYSCVCWCFVVVIVVVSDACLMHASSQLHWWVNQLCLETIPTIVEKPGNTTAVLISHYQSSINISSMLGRKSEMSACSPNGEW